MKSRFLYLITSFVFLFGMLAVTSPEVSAQEPAATPTAVSVQQGEAPTPGADTVSFFQIGQEDLQLTGPFDFESIVFGLPADWRITGSIELTLFLDITIHTVWSGEFDGQQAYDTGGLLSIEYNREEIGTFSISDSGEKELRVQIPLEFLEPIREDGRQELLFIFDSGLSCYFEQQMSMVIQDSSYIRFPHESIQPDTDLINFPYPLYQASIYPDKAIMVIPDNPSPDEIKSALTVSAGLRNRTGGNLEMTLVTYSELTPEQASANHLILIGTTASIPILDQLQLPLPTLDGNFTIEGTNEDDGVVQLINSTWSPAHVILLVSGNSGAGVVKSAQAISTGHLRPNAAPNLSIVQEVQGDLHRISSNVDQTLVDLGYETEVLERRGIASSTYNFYIPPGWTTGPDAFFELAFGNSALLDYERSGLNIEVNDQPVGSIRFTPETASQSINRVRISLPASIITPGSNTLEVIASLQPLDNCSSSQLRGIWANVWSDSRFHLPLIQTLNRPITRYDLSAYPAPLTFDSTLGSVAFVLQNDNVDSWRQAINVAGYLGNRSNGAITLLDAYFADEVPSEAQNNMNLVIIGNALQMPFVSELNEYLPAPFEDGSGLASESSMQVKFLIPSESPIGYIEFLNSPWNAERVIIAALGNTPQGVNWAASGLYQSKIRSRLGGNFSVINDQQVTTTDTRLAPPESVIVSPTTQPEEPIIGPSTPKDGTDVARPAWILPALVTSIILTILVVIGVLIGSIKRRREQSSIITEEGEDQVE